MTKFVLSIMMMFYPIFLTPLSQNNNAFLSGLTTDTNSSQQEQIQMINKKNAAQKVKEQELNVLKNFYGNPQYEAAMLILNNHLLQEEYQGALNDLSFFFFEYTAKVFSKFHPFSSSNNSKKKSMSSQTTSAHNQSSNAFLSNLEG